MYFVHFPLFYLSTYLLITIIIAFVLNDSLVNVTKITSIGLGMIIFVPIIDGLTTGGCFITYPSRLENYFLNFLNPFVSLLDIGVSIGQRVVIVLICILGAIYGYVKSESILKTTFLFFSILITILISGSITTIIALNQPEKIYISGGILNTDTQKFSAIYGIISFVFSFVYLFLLDKINFKKLISSIRIERMVFYGILGLSGFLLAQHQAGNFYKIDLFNSLAIFFLFICPGFGFFALQILNDFFDLSCDIISRPRNPIIQGINKKYYILAGLFLFFITIIFSAILSYQAFLIQFTFFLLGVIYSVPPIRLKRFPFVSTFIIAIAVVLSIAFGYSVIYFEKVFHQISPPLIFALLSSITIGFSAKDIQDIEADKKNGILTMPGIFYRGESLTKRFLYSLILGLSYILFAAFIPDVFIGSLLASTITFLYTFLNKNPRESIYFLLLYIFCGYLLFSLLFL